MASYATRHKIMKHLAAGAITWASLIERCSPEVGSQFFTEQALKEMIESGEIKRMADGQFMPGGDVAGKYDSYNEKRLDQWPKKGGPYSYQPENEPLTPKKGA